VSIPDEEKQEEERQVGQGAAAWAPKIGLWDTDAASAVYKGHPHQAQSPPGFGLAISDLHLRGGWIRTSVTLPDDKASARVVFGHDPLTEAYYSAGIGSEAASYAVDEFIPGSGWRAVRAAGSPGNLTAGVSYDVDIGVFGQYVFLDVDDVTVFTAELPHPLIGDQIGVVAWGASGTAFADLSIEPERPSAFVVMQYGEPFDSLFRDVIVPIASEFGVEALRADDVFAPGIIIQDIIEGLVRAHIVIADITPLNANVFYELGYAHALDKQTILLVERNEDGRLPFDVSGYRVIFYDNTIGGKDAVGESLRRYLRNILEGTS
jgi:hypothetical protein